MERKNCPVFEVDCVINFWDLADYAEMNAEELFCKMWPDNCFEDYADYGHYAIINVFDKTVYAEEDETREMWETVKFYIED